jgi:hypothetical protein
LEVLLSKLNLVLGSQRGQTTAEYALVILVAGLVVGVFATVVKSGVLADMFEGIIKDLLARALG